MSECECGYHLEDNACERCGNRYEHSWPSYAERVELGDVDVL